ncbi:magnesium transporter [Devosia geojensis]|uniref:Magnesium transport protein CorA n=1 Tax=Devosia geojensis TaxID=443610 RepID=A0A0F5FPA7_9HYPH|nr:magnesium transporter CorA family protein [Devosia geojensis]KKB10648.1 magnesium transporter [Devosia geojensis]
MLHICTPAVDHLVCTPFSEKAAVGAYDGAIWYDLLDPTPAEIIFVESTLDLKLPTREEMQDIEPSARLYSEAGTEVMTMTAMAGMSAGNPVKTPLTFVLRANVLITLRHADPKPFETFRQRAGKPNGENYATGEAVMAGLVEALIDRLAQALEHSGNDIDTISNGVFRGGAGKADRKTQDLQALIEKIGQKGDALTLLRESLVSIQRMVAFHQTREGPVGKPLRETRAAFKSLQRDAAALISHAEFLSAKITFLLDATLGLINLEQNKIIKIFSVVAVIFLPPTLVASAYGMNFTVMPELGWTFGYPFAIGLMALSAVLPYLLFKRNGWL